MGRRKNKYYWNQVTIEENGMWKCNKCGFTSSGGAKRIKAHIKRTPHSRIAPCSIDQDGLHHNVASGASNQQGPLNAVNSFQGLRPVHNVIGNNHIASNEEINEVNRKISDLKCEEDDVKGELLKLECRGKKRKIEVEKWLDDLQDLKRRAGAMIHSPSLSEIEKFTKEVEKHKQLKPLVLSTEIVGVNFEENIKKVEELLGNDQVFMIGIYGMAGVGKTLLARHVANEIKRKETFQDVFWVTASECHSISQLQLDIARRMGVKLDDDEDSKTRAEQLSLALKAKGKTIIILDDVWEYIDLEKVGIPFIKNGTKVIFTSRLGDVCREMDCSPSSMIRIEPLDCEREEDWKLFLVKLGHQGTPATLSPQVQEVGKLIVKICGGLPLAICVMARTMKPKLDGGIHWWKDKLNELQKGEMGVTMEKDVLEVLKCSYDKLPRKNMQECFLECALLPDVVTENELIAKLVEKGLIEGRTLVEISYSGLVILDTLKAHFLLEIGPNSIHILLRAMASYIKKTQVS